LNKTHPGRVRDAKYLTLLNSLEMIQNWLNKAPVPAFARALSVRSPKPFDEKELYGR
jgi:hypothetical protein